MRLFTKIAGVTAKKHAYMFSTRTKNPKNHLSTPQTNNYYLINTISVSEHACFIPGLYAI